MSEVPLQPTPHTQSLTPRCKVAHSPQTLHQEVRLPPRHHMHQTIGLHSIIPPQTLHHSTPHTPSLTHPGQSIVIDHFSRGGRLMKKEKKKTPHHSTRHAVTHSPQTLHHSINPQTPSLTHSRHSVTHSLQTLHHSLTPEKLSLTPYTPSGSHTPAPPV